MIPYGRQSIDEDDIEAVVSALRSDFLTTGPRVAEFEEAFARYCGVRHAVACANGTAALHLAMLAADIGAGDVVVTSPITFLASANAAEFVGAEIVFRDVEATAATLDAERLEQEWDVRTKAVVAVDYAGHPANHEEIGRIASERGAVLIEDGCHALGGNVQASDGSVHRVGGLPWVDMTTFSFHPVKTITTAEGGMVTTNRDDLAERLRLFRSHGMVRDPSRFEVFGRTGLLEEGGPWAYEMHVLGFNYRLSDLQCALGTSQLRKLDGFVARRASIARFYDEALGSLHAVRIPGIADWHTRDVTTGWHLYPLRLDFDALGVSRSLFIERLATKGVGTQVHYIPVCHQPFYRAKASPIRFPVAEAFYLSEVSLPLYPGMSGIDVETVVKAVHEVVSEFS